MLTPFCLSFLIKAPNCAVVIVLGGNSLISSLLVGFQVTNSESLLVN